METNDTENEPPSHNMNILHPNRYQVLINDGVSSFENEVTATNIKITQKPPSRKRNEIKIKSPRNMINRYTGKEATQLKQTKSLPGNTSHSNTVNKEKKILLLSDSILSRGVQMKLFNKELKTGRAYRKYFSGATPKEIAHYCILALEKDKPDVVVLNARTNSLLNSDVNEISDEMFKLVRICRNNGVKEVYISGITYRYNHATKVNLNNFIESKEHIYNFTFINNDNIFGKDIGVDNLHLNYTGIVKIANNIIYAINTSGT